MLRSVSAAAGATREEGEPFIIPSSASPPFLPPPNQSQTFFWGGRGSAEAGGKATRKVWDASAHMGLGRVFS